MILVLTGTHHQPFDRLVAAAEAYAAASGEEVVVQRGPSTVPAPHCESAPYFAPDRLDALADRARVLVAHGGPASLFLGWDRGLPVVVMPREAARGEHVDDHQVLFADHLGERILRVRDATGLAEALQSAGQGPSPSRMNEQASQHFAQQLASLVQDLLDR